MSQAWEYIKIALMNIKSNKGRSILTMLGIIIGISSVIMIISVGNGIKNRVNGELNDMAGGQLYLMVDSSKNKSNIEFTESDFDAIMTKVDHVKGVTPAFQMSGTVAGRKGNFDSYVTGGNHFLEFSSSDKIIKGRYFTEDEYYSARKVCIITEKSANKLFGTTDVIGMNLEVTMYNASQELEIVGIREDSSSALMGMMGYGDILQVEMPITVMGSAYGFYVDGFESCYIIGDSATYSTQIAQESIKLMEGRFNVRGEGIFTVQNFSDYMTQINSVLGYITLFVVFVAAISLLVGGIGVMNIMLVSVTERTREIGIRKALGARTGSILTQFLSESAIITLIGGIIGITLGVLGALGISALIGFTPEVKLTTVFGASMFSTAVGLFFGIYPAKKAAKLSPIEALRHE
ncbi:MAG: ABC transporter permease [Lachnospiraceae bacterium]|nr:ABC transporter permease [Lachnospiraceae bacterium]MDD3660294.1 ABC transporter permease [Lachnospiraceae bacterium]